MPNLTREESDERERFVIDSWKNAIHSAKGQNVPASVINALILKRYRQNMRGDKVYRLRDEAIKELRSAGMHVPDPRRKGDPRTLPETAAPPNGAGADSTTSGPPTPHGLVPGAPVMRRRGRPPGSKNKTAGARARLAPPPTRLAPPPARSNKGGFPLPHLIQLGQLPPADAVGHVLNTLRDAGLINIQVEVSGPSYVVVNTAR